MATKKAKKQQVRRVMPLIRELKKQMDHQALLTRDIEDTMRRLRKTGEMLDAAQAFISVSIEDDSE